jgi:hypothetical protein
VYKPEALSELKYSSLVALSLLIQAERGNIVDSTFCINSFTLLLFISYSYDLASCLETFDMLTRFQEVSLHRAFVTKRFLEKDWIDLDLNPLHRYEILMRFRYYYC